MYDGGAHAYDAASLLCNKPVLSTITLYRQRTIFHRRAFTPSATVRNRTVIAANGHCGGFTISGD
jgi:hypothetical protein